VRFRRPVTRKISRKQPNSLTTERVAGALPDDEAAAVEFAWRIHTSIRDWTALADVKASIVLPLESAIFAFVITQSSHGKIFGRLNGWSLILYWCGIALILLAMLSAAATIVPRLDRRQIEKTWRENFTYFGHLRRWDSKELAERLRRIGTADLDAISVNLITMSKIAWRKHEFLQASIALLVAAILLLVIAALI
jgi:pycsar effector protein